MAALTANPGTCVTQSAPRSGGTPIRFAVTVYPADRNQFEMEAGRVPAPDTTTPDGSVPAESRAGWEDEPSGSGSPHDNALDSVPGS